MRNILVVLVRKYYMSQSLYSIERVPNTQSVTCGYSILQRRNPGISVDNIVCGFDIDTFFWPIKAVLLIISWTSEIKAVPVQQICVDYL